MRFFLSQALALATTCVLTLPELRAEFNPVPYSFLARDLVLHSETPDLDQDGFPDLLLSHEGLHWCRALGASNLVQVPLAAP
jgi:hypothetical protein